MLRLWADKVANLCRERQRAAPRGRRGAPRPKGGAEQLGAMTHVPIAVSTTPLDRRPHGGCCTNFAGSKLWHRSVDRPPKLQSCWQGWLHLWLCVLLAMHITLQMRTAGSAAPLKTLLMSVDKEANFLDFVHHALCTIAYRPRVDVQLGRTRESRRLRWLDCDQKQRGVSRKLMHKVGAFPYANLHPHCSCLVGERHVDVPRHVVVGKPAARL